MGGWTDGTGGGWKGEGSSRKSRAQQPREEDRGGRMGTGSADGTSKVVVSGGRSVRRTLVLLALLTHHC